MIHRLALSITGRAVQKGTVKPENSDIYAYGTELIISSVLGVMISLILSFLFGLAIEGLAFIVIFAWVRRYTGGHHAKTHMGCIATFTLLITAALVVIKLTPVYVQTPLTVVFLVTSLVIVFLFAPVAHKNKPISVENAITLKRKSRILSCFLLMIITLGLLIYPALKTVCFSITLSEMFACVSLAYASHINVKERSEVK